MADLELWQLLAAVGGLLIAIDRAAGVLERLGLLPKKVLDWGRRYYKERMAAEAREIAVDALLQNGIRGRVEAAAADAKTAAEAAARAVEAAARAVAVAQESSAAMQAAFTDHITQSMEEHSAIGIQLTKLSAKVGSEPPPPTAHREPPAVPI